MAGKMSFGVWAECEQAEVRGKVQNQSASKLKAKPAIWEADPGEQAFLYLRASRMCCHYYHFLLVLNRQAQDLSLQGCWL